VRCASSIPRLWSGEREQDVITATAYRRQVHTTKVSRRDYNFELPTNNLNGEVGDKIPKGGEAYDYPGLYGNLAEADRYTKSGWRKKRSRNSRSMVRAVAGH
jgi:uncharacterized protein involved in type VI secretion and phage assembly